MTAACGEMKVKICESREELRINLPPLRGESSLIVLVYSCAQSLRGLAQNPEEASMVGNAEISSGLAEDTAKSWQPKKILILLPWPN